MKGEEFLDWDEEELPPETTEEVFRQLIRAISRHQGAGWFFVQCSPAKGTETIERLRSRFGKAVAVMELSRESETFYTEAKERYEQEGFKILVVRGVEQALYGYEDAKRHLGWDEEKIYNYDWQGVPLLLNHLNLVRERLRDNLPCAIVFLLPRFAVKYFIFRAPDFYDWGAGFFAIPEEGGEQQVIEWVKQSQYSEYGELSTEERMEKIAELRQVLERSELEATACADLLVEQGLLFTSGKDYELAISCFDKAIRVQKDCHRAWGNRGIALLRLGRNEEALASFDRAIDIKPDDENAWRNRGIALRHLGKYEEALVSFDRAIDIKPDDYYAWMNRGIALEYLGKYEEALASYDRAVKIKPDDYYSWMNRGIALGFLGKREEALVSFDRAVDIKPDDENAWMNRGNALRHLGKYEEAVASFDKAIEINPDYYSAWRNRGIALGFLGKHEEALVSFDRAIDIKPDDENAWMNRGNALRHLGKYEEAVASFDKAIALNPTYDSPYYAIALLFYSLNNIIKTTEYFKKAAEIELNDAILQNNIGFLSLLQGNTNEAIQYLEQAIIIDPTIFHAHFNFGLAFSLNSDFVAAKQKFKESFENCPKGDLQDRLYFALNQIILGQQKSGFDLLQETLKQIKNPDEPCLIRGGVLESAEILARFPTVYPGIDRALQLLQSALEPEGGNQSLLTPLDKEGTA